MLYLRHEEKGEKTAPAISWFLNALLFPLHFPPSFESNIRSAINLHAISLLPISSPSPPPFPSPFPCLGGEGGRGRKRARFRAFPYPRHGKISISAEARGTAVRGKKEFPGNRLQKKCILKYDLDTAIRRREKGQSMHVYLGVSASHKKSLFHTAVK